MAVVVAAGLALPVLALALAPPATLPLLIGQALALGLMAVVMMVAALAGGLWPALRLGLLAALALVLLARALGLAGVAQPVALGLVMAVAGLSFAARGLLFARAYPGRGWMIALFVVGGEAAMLAVASQLPPWLLLLLPAQWAATAIQVAIGGGGWAVAALLALGGTAATTLLVARLLPRRWPYALMFTAWLGLSALVAQWPAPARARADLFPAAAAWVQSNR